MQRDIDESISIPPVNRNLVDTDIDNVVENLETTNSNADIRSIISDMQFKFREGHCTLHALLKFQASVTAGLNVEKALGSALIEVLIHASSENRRHLKSKVKNFEFNLISIIS